MTDDVPFFVPDMTGEEEAAVIEVIRSRWLTTGARCAEFEARFAGAVGAKYAVALNSCTAALHLSLEALGVGPGDGVITSPYTFAATGEAVRYLGATPVFADIDPVDLNLSPQAVEDVLSRPERWPAGVDRIVALLPVHIAGVPCDLDALRSIARDQELAIVEDAAHAFPSHYKGRPIGAQLDGIRSTTCFSFYATKTLVTGEGGMLVTDDSEIAARARMMSLHGLSSEAWTRYSSGGTWAYDIVAPGFKYNMTDVAAAMGLVQLRRQPEMLAVRRSIAEQYHEAFKPLVTLETPTVPGDRSSSWHLYILRLSPGTYMGARDALMSDLRSRGISTSMHFIPLHLHSYYRDTYGYVPGDFPVAASEAGRAMSLPLYSGMTDDVIARVCREVKRAVADAGT